uniref:Uncharacterized protein n=1 Tax=Oryza sativa subsp. japonica TaxID=39947 RepID=Q6EP12_ORYSJ|nr:hypothetical protein [Oryza sativa Japonica Group]
MCGGGPAGGRGVGALPSARSSRMGAAVVVDGVEAAGWTSPPPDLAARTRWRRLPPASRAGSVEGGRAAGRRIRAGMAAGRPSSPAHPPDPPPVHSRCRREEGRGGEREGRSHGSRPSTPARPPDPLPAHSRRRRGVEGRGGSARRIHRPHAPVVAGEGRGEEVQEPRPPVVTRPPAGSAATRSCRCRGGEREGRSCGRPSSPALPPDLPPRALVAVGEVRGGERDGRSRGPPVPPAPAAASPCLPAAAELTAVPPV